MGPCGTLVPSTLPRLGVPVLPGPSASLVPGAVTPGSSGDFGTAGAAQTEGPRP